MATDQECRVAVEAHGSLYDQIVGFSTPQDAMRSKWGAPYYIRNVTLPPGEQEIWRGDSQDEMLDRCEIERMRATLDAVDALRRR
jgi:hypothetical protein